MAKPSDQNPQIRPVILCGGSGTRLWPVSRQSRPKQFIPLLSDHSMFQDTALHVSGDGLFVPPIIVTNESFEHFVSRQLAEINIEPEAIINEPEARNTSAAIALAALYEIEQDRPETCLLVLPSDHYLKGQNGFIETIKIARKAALGGGLVTFGVTPATPETGYGYILRGNPLKQVEDCYRVGSFVEKPDIETAEQFLNDGRYLWNSGMFLFTAQTIIDELEAFEPELIKAAKTALKKAKTTKCVVRPNPASFAKIKNISIDYAVMEKTKASVVVAARFGWNDVGAWTSVDELGKKDIAGNVLDGSAVLHECENTYVYSPKRLVVGVGLEDHIIVDTDDAVLVMPKDRAQDVKGVVERLKQEHNEAAVTHAKVHRPWGTYQGVDVGVQHQVKHIVVYPGGKLSLQYHHHRYEHWVVVSGTAEVTVNEDVKTLTANQSVYIPLGAVHRLYNPGKEPMHLIEVQYGDYLGEDDIVRLEDIYGRIADVDQEQERAQASQAERRI